MANNSSIRNWAEDDRPREKLMLKGASSLSNAELIAILLGSGTKEKSAVDVARELLSSVNNQLDKLGRLSIKDFQLIKGIGPAKAITLAAALELGRRRQSNEGNENAKVTSSADFAKIIMPLFQDLAQEVFYVFFLNNSNKITHQEIVSLGGTTATIADIKVIMKKALSHDAASICIAHNHPSGSLKASQADIDITKKVKEAATYLDIKLLDHIIVGYQSYFSFADEGML